MTDEPAAPPADAERAALLEAKLAELEASMRAAAIRAELKTEAADTAVVTLDEAGTVQGAAALVAALKRDKPWLFGAGSSSSTAKPPPVQPARPRLATEMSYAEWQAARRDLLRRR